MPYSVDIQRGIAFIVTVSKECAGITRRYESGDLPVVTLALLLPWLSLWILVANSGCFFDHNLTS